MPRVSWSNIISLVIRTNFIKTLFLYITCLNKQFKVLSINSSAQKAFHWTHEPYRTQLTLYHQSLQITLIIRAYQQIWEINFQTPLHLLWMNHRLIGMSGMNKYWSKWGAKTRSRKKVTTRIIVSSWISPDSSVCGVDISMSMIP